MSLEPVKVEAQTSSGTRIRVPVLLEKKDSRICFRTEESARRRATD